MCSSKWVVVVMLVLSAGLAGCMHAPRAARGLPVRAEALAEDVGTAKVLAARSLAWRERACRFITDTRGRLEGGVLTSDDLQRLYRGGVEYVALRRRWQALQAIQGDEAWLDLGPAGAAADPLTRVRAKLVLAAALMQHDDYGVGVEPYFRREKSRRLLKTDHPALEGELDATVRQFLNPFMRTRLAEMRSEDEKFLDEVIQQSAAYAFFTQQMLERLIQEWGTGGHAAVTYVTDKVADYAAAMLHLGSRAVGNTMGLVATRPGYLRELTAEERGRLAGKLEPLDVVLEKTGFRLTDNFIPGHYGHVAVWVGDEAELTALGIWEDARVVPHHAKIRGGARLIEALRSGVELNTLEHFLNIDDLLVLRPAVKSVEEKRAGLLRAFAQLGKEYDFNFDVESDRRIVCSELAFVVFPECGWPTSNVLGRASITPDQVAVKGLEAGGFRPVLLYHDGVAVEWKLEETLRCLLAEDAEGFRKLHPGFQGQSERVRR